MNLVFKFIYGYSILIQILCIYYINIFTFLKKLLDKFLLYIVFLIQIFYLLILINRIFELENFLSFLGFIFSILVILIITLCILWEYSILTLRIFNITTITILKFKNSIICLLILELLLLNLFMTNNFFIFYILFEISLIPTFYLISINGALQRKFYAGYIFMFYSIIGSIFLLITILYFYLILKNLEFSNLNAYNFSIYETLLLSIILLIGFSFKIPIWPFHYWLIEAHVQASTTGSVVLASLLLKIGTFGILKWIILIFKLNLYLNFVMLIFSILCGLSIIISGLAAILQFDVKKLIAYSSINHMSYAILGLCSGNIIGILGSFILMFSHGFIASGLFFIIGTIYDRYGIKLSIAYSGLNVIMPNLAFFFLIFTLFNISFPGTMSFIAEFFILLSLINKFSFLMIIFCTLTYINSIYSFNVLIKIFYGSGIMQNYLILKYSDLDFFESFILIILSYFVIIFGLFPIWSIEFFITKCLI
jgi:NADH-quinone oxidoreductase subunit M